MLGQNLRYEIDLEQIKSDKELYIKVLHENDNGYITIANKNDGKYSQYHYKRDDLINFIEDKDCYVSINSFYKPSRRTENLKELTALYIDLDYYKTEYRKESVLYFLESEMYGDSDGIPVPTLIVDSGRGLYLIWKIKNLPAQALPLYDAIQRCFCERLKEFGADSGAKDCARILRIPDTINSKSDSEVKIIKFNDVEYDIHEIQNEFLPEFNKEKINQDLHKKETNKKESSKRPKFLFNYYTLYEARLRDIETLCDLRNWDVKGHREEILFLYRYWSCCFLGDKDEALRRTLELNNKFKEPLSKREARSATKSAEECYFDKDKEYNYRNDTLINLLEMTKGEQKKMKTIISEDERKFRDNEWHKAKRKEVQGLTKREREKQEMMDIIKEKLNQGLGVKAIARELKVSVGRISEIKNNKY